MNANIPLIGERREQKLKTVHLATPAPNAVGLVHNTPEEITVVAAGGDMRYFTAQRIFAAKVLDHLDRGQSPSDDRLIECAKLAWRSAEALHAVACANIHAQTAAGG